MDQILTPNAPNLTVAPLAYDKRFMDQFANQLRLYFTQVSVSNEAMVNAAYSSSVMSWLSEGSF
jgi:hypothetical protein